MVPIRDCGLDWHKHFTRGSSGIPAMRGAGIQQGFYPYEGPSSSARIIEQSKRWTGTDSATVCFLCRSSHALSVSVWSTTITTDVLFSSRRSKTQGPHQKIAGRKVVQSSRMISSSHTSLLTQQPWPTLQAETDVFGHSFRQAQGALLSFSF